MQTESRVALALQSGEDTQEHDAHQVITRRVRCVIADGLLRFGESKWELSPSVEAALLWRAYQRYSELVGLKRLTGGLSGSDVMVFRPKLKPPAPNDDPDLATAGPAEVLADAWGSPLLVKTGKVEALRKEWARYNRFLRDRQSPFIAHLEELLVVQGAEADKKGQQAVLISSFLGGDVVRVEPLDKVIRGSRDTNRCLEVLDQVFAHLATWHTNPQPRPLGDWPRVFRFPEEQADGPPHWLLFGRYNFRKESRDSKVDWDLLTKRGLPSLGRHEFAAGLRWDVPFGKTEHLNQHLLGKRNQFDGLLVELMKLPVQFSLIHGDLNPRNVLCDEDKTWLIDFEHTGVGPILADFARLEINLRFWCITLGEATPHTGGSAEELERLLMGHFLGSESSLEPVRRYAHDLGANTDDLEKITRCIVHLRQHVHRWCLQQFTDGRDYLAVLYLTLLSLMPAASQPDKVARTNLRWGMGLFWVLEETLDCILGRIPFDRKQRPYNAIRQISQDWLNAPHAAERVHYAVGKSHGAEALRPVSALQGLLQGGYHHLDAYEHTLAVMMYLEEILKQPVESLQNSSGLDAIVEERFVALGLRLNLPVQTPESTNRQHPLPEGLSAWVEKSLDDEARHLLKWCSLLHDVGKAGTATLRKKGNQEEVQFLGHEVYGVTLLNKHLESWFPDERVRARLAELIVNHHRSHGLIGDYLLKTTGAEVLAQLQAGSQSQPDSRARNWLSNLLTETAEEYRPDLVLLLLHGYADRLAARGVKGNSPVADWANATLAVLAGVFQNPRWGKDSHKAAGQEQRVKSAAKRYADELGQSGHAIGLVRAAIEGREGTEDELVAWLRQHLPLEEIQRRVRAGAK